MSNSKINPEVRKSATRVLKNFSFLQKSNPGLFPQKAPAQGLAPLISHELLRKIHRPEVQAQIAQDKDLSKILDGVKFPRIGTASNGPLFNGTFHFAHIQFTIQDQGNAVMEVSSADTNIAMQYATLAAYPISVYCGQYGKCKLSVSPTIIEYAVTLPSASFSDAQLMGWVNDIAAKNGIPTNDCIVVLNPYLLVNTTAIGDGGYHFYANLPYIFANVYGQNLTIADQAFFYAQVLSHEMAETAVDPFANLVNPEVCDACAGNCNNLYLSYFDAQDNFIKTTQDFPGGFSYQYYINSVVAPGYQTGENCVPAADQMKACSYGFPVLKRINPLYLQHEQTAAWLIQLWLMIHGGDPAPEEIRFLGNRIRQFSTVRAIAALARCLRDEIAEKAILDAVAPLSRKVVEEVGMEI